MMDSPRLNVSKSKTASAPMRTIRFTLELEQTTDVDFPEFSYAELFEKAKSAERAKWTSNSADSNRKRDDDERREIEQIAAQMEAKYGSGGESASKRRVHDEDYIDVGSGYDETDPFVDNSEAHDDFVPFHLEPQHGGFYVNSGELYFSENQKKTETESNGGCDDDDDGDFQKKKAPRLFKLKPPKTKKTKDGKFEPKQKRAKIVNRQGTPTSLPVVAKVKKMVIKDRPDSDKTAPPAAAAAAATQTAVATPTILEDWPQDFPEYLKTEIEEWKQDVLKDNAMSKQPPKHFQSCYNSRLIKIGRQTMALKPKKYQTRVYDYLTSFLPATKGTLLKRLKDLLSAEHKELMKEPLEKLKLGIETCMLEQVGKLEERRKTLLESQEKFIEDDLSDDGGDNGTVPLKRFVWTEELKDRLCNLVSAKIQAIREINKHLIDPPAQILSFLKDEVKVLWPSGWMNSKILYEVSRKAHDSFTQLKVKKKKDPPMQPKPKPPPPLTKPLLAMEPLKLNVSLGSALSQHSYSLPPSSSQPAPSSNSSLSPPSIFISSSSSQPASLPPLPPPPPPPAAAAFVPQSPTVRLVSSPLQQQPQQLQQVGILNMNVPVSLFKNVQMTQRSFPSSAHADHSKPNT
ncbi:ubinuclein-2-like [Oscarella lobularis]|uniref:ubinuclein-2-like n=1 Tax=Oscarella lobularis TaxID=121494 RepID=UPI003313A291